MDIVKRFIQKQLLLYFITNLLINALVTYFGFDDKHAVHLFHGAHPLARFLIPMSVFIPFGTTFDILKKTDTFQVNNGYGPLLPSRYPKLPYMLKWAGINGGITGIIVSGIMLLLHYSLPSGYTFDGLLLAIFSGCLAGGMAIIFTIHPLNMVKKLPPD